MPAKAITVKFEKDKETKRKVRYTAPEGAAVVGNLYLDKADERGDTITVTVK